MHKMTESAPRSRMPGDREMVFMMAMVMALNALAIDSMLPALPAIGEGLGVAVANDRQYVISTYLLGIGIGSLFYGPLSEAMTLAAQQSEDVQDGLFIATDNDVIAWLDLVEE